MLDDSASAQVVSSLLKHVQEPCRSWQLGRLVLERPFLEFPDLEFLELLGVHNFLGLLGLFLSSLGLRLSLGLGSSSLGLGLGSSGGTGGFLGAGAGRGLLGGLLIARGRRG